MAKKQTRRSISVSRTTYERLKAFCEANNISMSQLVETRVNDFLGEGVSAPTTIAPRPTSTPSVTPSAPRPVSIPASISSGSTPPKTQETASIGARPSTPAVPMTSAAARFAVDPPPPIIKQKQDTNAPKPAEKRPDQIFTF
ncbi:MAG TPA: hypothetical protein VGM90_07535 [Kofleriaceae bacterium]